MFLIAARKPCAARSTNAAAALELYGTFHAMGVVVNLTAGEDPDQDAMASVSYRVSGSGAYRPGFPLSRVSSTRFAGSLFWLTPSTAYDVRVTFSDPDGGPLNGVTMQATATTATGQEPNGRSVTPSFAKRASGDYTLAAASGLIDAGVIVPGINDDYVGAAPDLGAFERDVTPVTNLRVTNAITASGTLTATASKPTANQSSSCRRTISITSMTRTWAASLPM